MVQPWQHLDCEDLPKQLNNCSNRIKALENNEKDFGRSKMRFKQQRRWELLKDIAPAVDKNLDTQDRYAASRGFGLLGSFCLKL